VGEATTQPSSMVTRADAKAALLMRADPNGYVHFALERNPVNRQATQQYWLPGGLFYIAPTELYRSTRSFYTERTLPFETDADIAADIDTAADFERALDLLAKLRAGGRIP
jgi:CMP-N-acetylneuraminic acid synthetase